MAASPYAAEKLISQARQLAAEFRRMKGKPLPGISNEIAEFDAIHLLDLELNEEKQVGWDALDPDTGNRIQIKSRTIFDESKSGQRLGQLKMNQEWDAVVLVLMDEDYQPYEIYEAKRDDIETYINASSSSRAKRGTLTVARFKIISRLRWDSANGLQNEVWDNQSDG